MAAATAPAAVWVDDLEDVKGFRTPADMAGGVAWDVLSHSQHAAPGLRVMWAQPLPDGMDDEEDMPGFLFDLISEAGRIGYLVGKIDADAFRLPGLLPDDQGRDPGAVSTSAIARAILSLTRTPVDEGGVG